VVVDVNGLKLNILENNLDPIYHHINNVGILASNSSITWTFEYVKLAFLLFIIFCSSAIIFF
jgi:hypothetical protein